MSVPTLIVLATLAAAQPHAPGGAPAPSDWRADEAPLLTDHVQLTTRDRFVKAGEAYFSPDGEWIIFQAVPVPAEGEEPEPFYSMYVAKLTRDADGAVTGLDKVTRISPEGSANTCGWFHPSDPGRVIYGSTLVPPASDQRSGFQVGTRKYVWLFPQEMQVVSHVVPVVAADVLTPPGGEPPHLQLAAEAVEPRPVFDRPNYDAECSYTMNGRFILYAHVRDAGADDRPDADLWVYDTKKDEHHALVTADGYDGGPFFSPDGRSICYRSDREGDDLLQVFTADLVFDAEGVPVGVKNERQLTNNEHVNWAPYWHPSGRFLVYATSEVGHHNYEVFAIDARGAAAADGDAPKRRITTAAGADVLPVFSPDGSLMMWTSQRGPKVEGEDRPSSQLWIARFAADGVRFE